jgi:hypothetical protein
VVFFLFMNPLPAFSRLIPVGMLAWLTACTATEQSAETATPSTGVPTEVRTDADRRAIYENNGVAPAVPDATPNRMRLGEQAADINRRKRVENVNTNDANNTTPETRLRRLDYSSPLPDTMQR